MKTFRTLVGLSSHCGSTPLPMLLGPSLCVERRCAASRARGDAAPDAAAANIEALVGRRDLAAAVNKLHLADPSSLSPNAVGAVLHLCEQLGEKEETGRILNRIVRDNSRFWKENILSVLLRHQCEAGDLSSALQTAMFIAKANDNVWKKRNVSPLLLLCCRAGDRAMTTHLLAEVRRCDVHLDALDIESLVVLFSAPPAAPLKTLHDILVMVAEYHTFVTRATAEAIVRWRGDPAAARLTHVEGGSGSCCACGARLEGFPFTVQHRATILDGLKRAVAQRSNGRQTSGPRVLEAWSKLLFAHPKARDADVIIDGANVGYYGLSGWYGIVKAQLVAHCRASHPERLRRLHDTTVWKKQLPFVDVPVSLDLIDTSLAAVRALGHRPIIVLHERHLEPHNMFPSAAAIAERWRAEGILFTTPSGLNDDICWLHAAVSMCTPSDTPTEQRRRVLVLTNDNMRDHHFALVHQPAFAAWRGRHQLKFCCVREDDITRVVLQPPELFTQCIQHNASLASWHIPVAPPLAVPTSVGRAAAECEEQKHHPPSLPDEDGMQPNDDDAHNDEPNALPGDPTWLCLR